MDNYSLFGRLFVRLDQTSVTGASVLITPIEARGEITWEISIIKDYQRESKY